MTPPRQDVKPFEYVEANVPFYPPGKSWGTTADPIKKMQKPLPPEESRKHFVHPAVVRDGRYVLPRAPGYSVDLHPDSYAALTFPGGAVWTR